ncbi:splicing factor 3A subunit 2-like [Convolutriloba macropyga]|uniref:splicing factor 3A subunit 2-like n=1 Tax=Convolutriloba macropyga TaxID=536237 RepID=UPI003F522F9D
MMDFQNRAGGKTGSGGVASASETNRDRRERLRQLALETIDLAKDPYFMKNHLGSYECKLCLTLHNNEGSYLAHTQGKKHQSNLARRAATEAKEAAIQPAPEKPRVDIKKFVKIGRPGYRVTKQLNPANKQQSLLFQIDYPEIADGVVPRHRFMSAYEQRIEPPDRRWQYLLFAAEPYETIAFKVPSREVEKGSDDKFFTVFNPDTKTFFLQFSFKNQDRSFPKTHQQGPTHAPQIGDKVQLPPPPGGLGMPPPPPPNLAPSLTPGPMPAPIGTPMLPPPPPPSV